MAANYSQYTDHNEIGGVSVGLEDAKLAAADSVDEVASTDCVLMKDASGNPVKILKEDFNEAVRDALGSILSNSELGVSIGRVTALGSSDNDFGSLSTGDLASVLDVISQAQLRDYQIWYADDNPIFDNPPVGVSFPISFSQMIFSVRRTDGPAFQIQNSANGLKVRSKWGGAWSEWKSL